MSDNIESINFDVEAAASDENVPDRYTTDDDELGGDYRTQTEKVIEGIRTSRKIQVGIVVVVGFLLVAVLAPVIAPYNPSATFELTKQPNTFSETDIDNDGTAERVWHPLGTDSFGHDLLSRIIFGARVSLVVAFATMALSFTLGTTIGIVAAYYGGWVDNALMRYVDFQWAFPELILAIGIIAFTGTRGVANVVIALGLAYVDDFARIIRGEILSIREEEYVRAAEAVGMGDIRIMFSEIFPNAIAPVIVQATIMIPLAILAEASLSFLGLGVKPTTPTWGILINVGRQYILSAWWISVFPGLAIMVTVLGFNLFGDGLRDVLDVSEGEVEER